MKNKKITLNNKERDDFLKELSNPKKPNKDLNELMRGDNMKAKSIYIYPEKETIKLDGGEEFAYFYLKNEKGEIVDYYDYLDIKGNIRIDVQKINGKKVIRLFTKCSENLDYDTVYHELTDSKAK